MVGSCRKSVPGVAFFPAPESPIPALESPFPGESMALILLEDYLLFWGVLFLWGYAGCVFLFPFSLLDMPYV